MDDTQPSRTARDWNAAARAGAIEAVEEIEGRASLRRSRRRWRIATLVLVGALLLALAGRAGTAALEGLAPHVARLTVEGVIVDDPDRDRLLAKVRDAEGAKALVVRINSPGGTVAGSEALYVALRRVAEEKPVVAVMRETAASGGYIAALAAERVWARETTATGSIGVISTVPNAEELLDRLGVRVIEVKSGALKAEPTPYGPVSEAAQEAQAAFVADAFAWFLGLVEARRGLTGDALDAVDDGAVYTGRRALELGLIDAIGGEREARAWLEEAHGIDEDMAPRDYALAPEAPGLLALLGRSLGVEDVAALRPMAAPGLWAIWR